MTTTTPHALIVDDDPAIIQTVGDIVRSLDHDADTASDIESAIGQLATRRYDYLILDMKIPVSAERKLGRRENGRNLIGRLRNNADTVDLPIIVITGEDSGESDFILSVIRVGGMKRTEYIQKPVDGDKLDCAIQRALQRQRDEQQAPQHPAFTTGSRDMVITEEAITLCGVEVWSDHAQDDMREVLVALAGRTAGGRYRRIRGPKLNEMVDRDPTNPISKPIQRFRDRCTELMASECQLACGKFDVICETKGGGYHLHDCIEVTIEPGLESLADAHDEEPTTRQEVKAWILEQLEAGVAIYPRDVIAAFSGKRDRSTITRDLAALRADGVIGRGVRGRIVREDPA